MCTAATALCALAPSLGVLVAVRFVMGFSGAAGVVVGRAVIADVADGALGSSWERRYGRTAPAEAVQIGDGTHRNQDIQ
jgi:MFS family permease